MELEHLSYSSISAYLACPQAWRFKYLEGIPTPTSPELVFGSAVHDAVEHWIADKSQPLLTSWPEVWAKRTEGAQVAWGADSAESFCNDGVRILGNADVQKALGTLVVGHDDKGPMIERRIELSVPGVPVPVIGFIDLIGADGIPCDLKTSSRAWTQDRAQSETQSLFYLAALNQAGIHTHNWRFRHVVIVKTKTPQVQVMEHHHSRGEIFWLFGLIRSVWQGIERQVFPCNPGSWKCNAQYCDYWHLCRGKYL